MDTYNKYYKKENKKYKKYLTKILISIIFFLVSIIYIKLNNNNKSNYEQIFLKDSISFTKINNWYNNYFGKIVPLPDVSNDTQMVFNENIVYTNSDNYLNGKVFTVEQDYIVPSLQSGIIVFMGEKEGYGNTLIVQGIDGYDVWYCNVDYSNLNLYDYVKKGESLTKVNDNYLYIVIMKDNNYISYEEYIQS